MVSTPISQEDKELFEQSAERVRARKKQALARKQAYAALAKEKGISPDEAKLVFAEMQRKRKEQQRLQALQQKKTEREQLAAQRKAEQEALKPQLEFQKEFAKAVKQQESQQRVKERKQKRQAQKIQTQTFQAVGVLGPSAFEDWLQLGIAWSLVTTTTAIIAPLGGIYQAVSNGWDNFCSSQAGRIVGCQAGDESNTAVNASGQAIATKALEWVGKEFNPGVKEQCAIFVREVLASVGINVGVTKSPIDNIQPTGEAYANGLFGKDIGTLITDRSDVQAGDLIFFYNTYGNYKAGTVTHVAIAVDNKEMVDRPTASAPVKKRPIDTFEFAGAIRLDSGGSSVASAIAADFMKQPGIEGFHEKPYWDYAQWSWGHGTKAPCNSAEECQAISITPEQAKQEMMDYLSKHCSPLLQALSLNENQEAAALSLCYNYGPEQFQISRPYLEMKNGNLEEAAKMFDACVHAGGVKLAGLVKRRSMEQELWGLPDPLSYHANGASCLVD